MGATTFGAVDALPEVEGATGYVVPGVEVEVVGEQGKRLGADVEGCAHSHAVGRPTFPARARRESGFPRRLVLPRRSRPDHVARIARLKRARLGSDKAGGVKNAPELVEDVVLQHESVAEAAAFGAMGASGVEEIDIAIVFRAPVAERALINGAPNARSKWRGSSSSTRIPKTPMGKIRRNDLKARCSHDGRDARTAISAYRPAPQRVSKCPRPARRRPPQEPQSVERRIDERPIGQLQFRVFLLCGLAIFAEGYERRRSPMSRRPLRKSGASPRGVGSTFAAGVAGLSLGALLIAPLADRYGRRPDPLAVQRGFRPVDAGDRVRLRALWAARAAPADRVRAGRRDGQRHRTDRGIQPGETARSRRRHHVLRFRPRCGNGGRALRLAHRHGRLAFGVRRRGLAGTPLLAGALALWLPYLLRFLALRGRQAEVARLAPEFASIGSPPPGLGTAARALGSACCSGTAGRR